MVDEAEGATEVSRLVGDPTSVVVVDVGAVDGGGVSLVVGVTPVVPFVPSRVMVV